MKVHETDNILSPIPFQFDKAYLQNFYILWSDNKIIKRSKTAEYLNEPDGIPALRISFRNV